MMFDLSSNGVLPPTLLQADSAGYMLPWLNQFFLPRKMYTEFRNVPRFYASLDCRKQGSYQIHVEQRSWQDKSSMSKWKYI
jgi:hypothetical protein